MKMDASSMMKAENNLLNCLVFTTALHNATSEECLKGKSMSKQPRLWSKGQV